MKEGDIVQVIGLPDDLEDVVDTEAYSNEVTTKKLFEMCIGKMFPIYMIQDNKDFPEEVQIKLVGLEVGEVLGEADFMETIWIETKYLKLISIC